MQSLKKIVLDPLLKLRELQTIIKSNGGIRGSLWQLFRTDDLKYGDFVGEDKYGNKYYENKKYFFGRNRWVIYNEDVFLDYDASQVPPDWHGWLHYMTDLPPTINPMPKYSWMIDHTENPTGASKAYTPYSTTRNKIEPWIPKDFKMDKKLSEGGKAGADAQLK